MKKEKLKTIRYSNEYWRKIETLMSFYNLNTKSKLLEKIVDLVLLQNWGYDNLRTLFIQKAMNELWITRDLDSFLSNYLHLAEDKAWRSENWIKEITDFVLIDILALSSEPKSKSAQEAIWILEQEIKNKLKKYL